MIQDVVGNSLRMGRHLLQHVTQDAMNLPMMSLVTKTIVMVLEVVVFRRQGQDGSADKDNTGIDDVVVVLVAIVVVLDSPSPRKRAGLF